MSIGPTIGAIYLLSLVFLLMRIMASFLCYTGNLNLKKTLYMSCFIANSSSCTTTELSIPLPSYLTAIKSKKVCKDQESIQSSATPDPGYQWESDKLTVRHHKREPRGHSFPSR